MYISKIGYRTNVEVAPYKHEHIEVHVELTEADDADEAVAHARHFARQALGIDVTPSDVEKAEAILKAAKKAGLR